MIGKTAFLLAVVAVLLSSSLGFAQDAPVRFLQVATLTAAPGMTGQFENVMRQINEAFKQTGAGPQVALTYATAMGGNGATYYVVTPFNAWSDVDSWRLIPAVLVEAYGEEEGAKILAAGDASLLTRETSTQALMANLSSPSTSSSDEAPRFARVITTRVDPSRSGDYFQYMSKLKEAEEAAGLSTTRRAMAQGQTGQFTAVRFFNTFTERESWQGRGANALLRDHLGDNEANALIQRQNDAVVSRQIQVLAYRPDLSRVPAN